MLCSVKGRVTIFVKAKIGTTDGHFARCQSGTLKLTCRLHSAGNRRGFEKKRNRDDLQKKKKKVNTCLAAHFVSLLGRKLHKSRIQTGFDLFFLFGDHSKTHRFLPEIYQSLNTCDETLLFQ